MTKYLIPACLFGVIAVSANAKTITPEEALQRMEATPASAPSGLRKAPIKNPELVHTQLTKAGDPAVYVFNRPMSGYMLLSADDVAYPVLGYSDSGLPVDPGSMPDAMKWWLEEYARQIEYAKANGVMSAVSTRKNVPAGRKAIEPMLKTHWDQGEPYNLYCPVVSGALSYTGCVATSLAQIMYYFKYPAVGTGSISYNDDDGCGKRLTWQFSDHPFEWDKMKEDYIEGQYTQEEAQAVAILMKSAGAAVKMSYAADASGALSLLTPNGLVKYLGYDPNLSYVIRSTVSATEWDNMVYENILNVGPVLYGGGSMLGGGHSFVLDGYDGNGYYHFNWGWSEMSDGYYSLDALNPSALGTGGGTGGGYNFTQDGVFGIQPPTGKPAEPKPLNIYQMGNLNGSFEGAILSLELTDEMSTMWVNYMPTTVKVRFGAIIEPLDAAGQKQYVPFTDDYVSLQPGYGANVKVLAPKVDFSALGLADGKYKLTVAAQENASQSEWVALSHDYGSSSSLVVTKTGNTYTVSKNTTPFYTINSLEFEGGLYYGCLANVKYSVTNNTDTEISRGLAPVLFKNDGTAISFLGDGKFITLAPGETAEGSFVTSMYMMEDNMFGVTADTQYILSVFEESTYSFLADQYAEYVTMHPNPGLPGIEINPAVRIENCSYELEGFKLKKVVTDPTDIHVTAGIKLNSGMVAYPTYIVLAKKKDDDPNSLSIVDYGGENVFLSNSGETANLETHFNFKSAVDSETYYLQICYLINNGFYPAVDALTDFIVRRPSGIESVTAEADSEISFDGTAVTAAGSKIELYNVQGMKVAYGFESLSVDGLPHGMYIARTATSTLKIAF